MKGICYLVCAGESIPLDFAPRREDFVIAVDGGYAYLENAAIEPDLAVGDFDSLGRVPSAAQVIRLDSVKDVTDTFAAAQEGLKRGYKEFRLYCALGGRYSHAFANVNTLSYLLKNGACAKIIGADCELAAVNGRAEFLPGGYLSVIPLTETAVVRITGCKYSGTFTFTYCDSLGVSNEPLENAAIEVLEGEVLTIVEKH